MTTASVSSPRRGVMLERRHDGLPRADVAEQAHAQLFVLALGASLPSSRRCRSSSLPATVKALGLRIRSRVRSLGAASQFWQRPFEVAYPCRPRGEPGAVELAVDHHGHPPAGDVVTSQLEESAGHG